MATLLNDYSSVAGAYMSLVSLIDVMKEEGKLTSPERDALSEVFDRGVYSASPVERAVDSLFTWTGWVEDDSVKLYLDWVKAEVSGMAIPTDPKNKIMAVLGASVTAAESALEANVTPTEAVENTAAEIKDSAKEKAESYAVQGALVGAAAGALAGAPLFGIGTGPGAVVGAAVGALIGNSADTIKKMWG